MTDNRLLYVLYLFHSASFSGPFNQLLENIDKFQSKAKDAISLFEQFKQESRTKSSLFAFWDDYCTIVNILLQFIKAERTGKVLSDCICFVLYEIHFYSFAFHIQVTGAYIWLPQRRCCRTSFQWIGRITPDGFLSILLI